MFWALALGFAMFLAVNKRIAFSFFFFFYKSYHSDIEISHNRCTCIICSIQSDGEVRDKIINMSYLSEK